jgi:hypothetical protein
MYITNLPRAIAAIGLGTIAGGILVVLWSFWGVTDMQYLRQYWRRDATGVFVYAVFVWAVGLIVIAPGPWLILHRMGKRHWLVAVALGSALTFAVALGLLQDAFGLHNSVVDQLEASNFALVSSTLGGIVGFVVWRTAYRWVPSAT